MEPERPSSRPVGLAHVATLSFLASRASPSGAFWLAIGGGIALARAASSAGWRSGFGCSLAAMLQTTALLGAARFNGPLTQALTAPVFGYLHGRGAPLALQLLVCFCIRLAHYVVLAAAFVWIVLGGVDALTGTYDAIAGWVDFLPPGSTPAVVATLLMYGVAAFFYSGIQVAIYHRALRQWPDEGAPATDTKGPYVSPSRPGVFDPRAATLAAVVASALLLASTAWLTLAAVAAWLAVATVTSRPDPQPLRLGLALTVLLSGSAFAASIIADLGSDEAARRATRAALLVLVATWLRAAAGADGMRAVFARALRRLHSIPGFREAAVAFEALDARSAVIAPGRELLARLKRVPAKPLPLIDALVHWVASETAGFAPADVATAARVPLRVRARDAVLVATALAPTLALIAT